MNTGAARRIWGRETGQGSDVQHGRLAYESLEERAPTTFAIPVFLPNLSRSARLHDLRERPRDWAHVGGQERTPGAALDLFTVYVPPTLGIRTNSRTATLEDAKAAFRASWEKCRGAGVRG